MVPGLSTGMGWLATVGKMDAVFTVALPDSENITVHTTIQPYYDHPDINVFERPLGGFSDYGENLEMIVSVLNQTQWDKMKTKTSLTKPPLILGLDPKCSLGVPISITTDTIHLAGNLSDLLITLWHGTINVGTNDDCCYSSICLTSF